jgi:endo-1,4-beta-xylanase
VAYTKDFDITVQAAFVAVTNITGVPTTATAGTALTLTGTVNPATATNKTITWSVKDAGTTGASISGGNTLNTTGTGTVTVTASIANGLSYGNYTQDFDITVLVAVTGITGIPTTMTERTILVLTGTVSPPNATNKTITWSIYNYGGTGASLSNNELIPFSPGTVEVRATIVNGLSTGDYIQHFYINVTPVVPVTNITDVPTTAAKGNLTLTGTVAPTTATNKTITWSVKDKGTTNAQIAGTTLNTTATGTVTVTATIASGVSTGEAYTQDFTIAIN